MVCILVWLFLESYFFHVFRIACVVHKQENGAYARGEHKHTQERIGESIIKDRLVLLDTVGLAVLYYFSQECKPENPSFRLLRIWSIRLSPTRAEYHP